MKALVVLAALCGCAASNETQTHAEGLSLPPELKPPLYRFEPFTLEGVRRYADQGVDLLSPDGPGTKWMYRAVYDLQIDIMEYLLEKGRKANDLIFAETPSLWWIAYHSGISKGDQTRAVELLLQHGANIDFASTFEEGDTPLHAIVEYGNPKLAALLIERGADKEAVNDRGETPLFKAMEMLRRYKYDGVVKNDAMIKSLIEEGCDTETACRRNVTPLHIAAFVGRTDLAKAMLGAKKYSDVVTVDRQTPLHVATLTRTNSQMVRLLLKAGADPNLRDVSNERPLDIAERKNFIELVQILRSVTGR
ncbi:MAG: ankyrin repeat domain-containing protein [Fimbriimonadales bacterium]